MFSNTFSFKNHKSENPAKNGFSGLKPEKIFLLTPILVLACSSSPIQTSSPTPKIETLKANVCETEGYADNPEYKQRSEKEYLNKLENGEEIYLETIVERCEEVFSEGGGIECGIQKTIKLVWQKDKKPIDSFSFLNSGCQEPNAQNLRMEPWDQNDVTVRNGIVKVRHYWNYYSHSEEEDERCMFHVFKLDRRKLKFHDLGEKSCR